MPPETPTILEPEEQFADTRQQREAVTFGMWIFLATEVLFFGGPLIAYSVYRVWYPDDFAFGSRHLDFLAGTTNTAVLLTSSFFMAGAVTAGRLRDRRTTILLLLFTALLGAVFLTIKGYEWYSAIRNGFSPISATATPNLAPGVHLFYSLYFILTGLHGLHLLIGIALLAFTMWRFRCPQTFAASQNGLSLIGLYWHFIDIIWIFLFPLLYFIGRSS